MREDVLNWELNTLVECILKKVEELYFRNDINRQLTEAWKDFSDNKAKDGTGFTFSYQMNIQDS